MSVRARLDGLIGAPREVDMVQDPPTPAVEADRDAIRRCQAGDRAAYQPIVERYGDVLFGTAFLMLGDRGLAEDAAQDAFVSAWVGIRSFDPERPLRPWLVRILVNHVLQRRRRKRLRMVPLSETEAMVASSEVSPERAAERAWERREIHRALAALPADAAQVIVLRYFAELSLAEVAAVLELPTGTVKSRLHRALEKLRLELVSGAVQGATGVHEEKEVGR